MTSVVTPLAASHSFTVGLLTLLSLPSPLRRLSLSFHRLLRPSSHRTSSSVVRWSPTLEARGQPAEGYKPSTFIWSPSRTLFNYPDLRHSLLKHSFLSFSPFNYLVFNMFFRTSFAIILAYTALVASIPCEGPNPPTTPTTPAPYPPPATPPSVPPTVPAPPPSKPSEPPSNPTWGPPAPPPAPPAHPTSPTSPSSPPAPSQSSGSTGGSGGSTCSTGPVQCCNSVQPASSKDASKLLGLLGIVLGNLNTPIGITCSPITAIGLGGGANWYVQIVICTPFSIHAYTIPAMRRLYVARTTLTVCILDNLFGFLCVTVQLNRRTYQHWMRSYQRSALSFYYRDAR